MIIGESIVQHNVQPIVDHWEENLTKIDIM